MRKILLSIATVAFIGSLAVGATGALFSDTETSTGNTFTAGSIDLKIDNHAWYNGELQPDFTWELSDMEDHLFFNYGDLKPGDWEEDTISIHVENNDAWLCANLKVTEDDDVSSTEPELDVDDPEDPQDSWDGELGQELHFIFWADDGDNVLEDDEQIVLEGTPSELPRGEGNPGKHFPIVDSTFNLFGTPGEPLPGGETRYIGKAFCFGEMTLTPITQDGYGDQIDPSGGQGPGFACSGATATNVSQSDSLMGDLSFTAVQSRNNGDYVCERNGNDIGCQDKLDLMLVLDRSGSIGPTDLTTLQTAAKAFVDALVLEADGPHAGLVSFAFTGSLDEHLTDDAAAVKAAIDALTTSGLTNLQDAILEATDELANPGDGHDRDDGDSPDFLVIITDGAPTTSNGGDPETAATAAANAADAAGIEIYVVGVDTTPSTADYLRDNIATTPAHYFDAGDFGDLQAILDGLAECNNG